MREQTWIAGGGDECREPRRRGGSGVNTFENQTVEPNRAKVTLVVFNPCFFFLICTPGT